MQRILLIDHHDTRRETREGVLRQAGYEVVSAENFEAVEGHLRETAFDLVIIAVKGNADRESLAYSQRLRAANPQLPILALSDRGIFLPKESLLAVLETGRPVQLIAAVATMLLASTHVRNHVRGKKPPNSVGAAEARKPDLEARPVPRPKQK